MLSRHHRRIGTSVRAVALVAFAVMVFFFASAQLSAMQQANAATVAQQQVSAVEAVVGPPLSGAAVQAVMVPAPVTAIQPAVTDAGGATREVSCTVANDPDMCLPMFRWASSSSHIVNAISVDISITNLDFGWVGPLIGSLALGLVMSIGSLPWLILGLLTKMASSSVVSMQAWEFADKITANIGSFLFTGPGIAGFVVVLIIVVIAMSLRRKPAKTIGLYALVTVLLMGVGLVVTTGADNSTPSSEGTPYAAGTMSPGWIGIKATSLTTGLSSAISNMAVSLIPAAGSITTPRGNRPSTRRVTRGDVSSTWLR